MSKVLGPIHHWLYAKIGRQEELSACLAETALAEAWISDAAPYLRELAPLEQVIDEENIHAWLHEQPWSELGGELFVYYLLRRRVMAGMLEGSGLVLESPDKDHYCLKPAR